MGKCKFCGNETEPFFVLGEHECLCEACGGLNDCEELRAGEEYENEDEEEYPYNEEEDE